MAALKEFLQPAPSEEPSQRLTAVPDINALIKTALQRPPRLPAAGSAAVPTRRDPATAFDLIDRAAAALEMLVRRCEELEAKMQADAERAEAEAAAQDEIVAQWKNFGTGMKSQAEDTDRQLQAMRARAEAAEARAASAEARATALQQTSEDAARQAAAAENLSTEFHDKVIATFGIGSRAHSVLEIASKMGPVDQAASDLRAS